MKIEIGKAYETETGRYAYIMGPARRNDYPDALWSLQGDHYLPDGRKLGYRVEHALWPDGTTHSKGVSYVTEQRLVREVPVGPYHENLAAEWAAKRSR